MLRPACVADLPISTRFELASNLREFNHWFTSVAPFHLACRARAVWQYQLVPSLSGLLATLPCASRVRLPSASPTCCDRPEAVSFHHRTVTWRLVAHAGDPLHP